MCSILQGMLGKIYYANVYSAACFCSPSALVALKKKMWCYFCEQRHLTKKMQSACIQYPNFYGFVLWNLNVYKTTALTFFFYIINGKTPKPALYLSFIF